MEIKKFGESGKKILLLPGLLNSYESLEPLYTKLMETYQCYVVDFNDTHKFDSLDKVCDNIKELVDVECFDLVYGISLGGNIALTLASKYQGLCNRVLIDGGLFFSFPKLVRMAANTQIFSFMNQVRKASDDEGIELAKNHATMKQVIGNIDNQQYPIVIDMIHTIKSVDDKFIQSQLDGVLAFKYPNINNDEQSKLIFLFGSNDPSYKCKEEVEKHYPGSAVLVMDGYGYFGLLTHNLDAYLDIIRTTIS